MAAPPATSTATATAGSNGGKKDGGAAGTEPNDMPMLSPNQPVSVISASTMEPASQQHGQEAPLCLGPLVDSESRDELMDSPEAIAAMQRRISLPGAMRSSMSTRCVASPSPVSSAHNPSIDSSLTD